MSKYYEKTKSIIQEILIILVTFNKNGLMDKRKFKIKQRIISAAKPEGLNLIDVTIFHLDKNLINEKIILKKQILKIIMDFK